jgi:streptomycin 6-kinase
MLKLARHPEECRGNRLMAYWGQEGIAPVIASSGNAILMSRAQTSPSLPAMVRSGHDEEATAILCGVADRVHRSSAAAHTDLVPLGSWFEALFALERKTRFLTTAARYADELLASQTSSVVLHGDLHHGNVLRFGEHWFPIDPKALIGAAAFDYVNILRNPNIRVAGDPKRLAQHASIISRLAGIERETLLKWLFAFCGLSAAWHTEAGEQPTADCRLMQLTEFALR